MGCINSTNKHIYAFKRDEIFNVSVVRVQSERPVVLATRGYFEISPHELVFTASDREPFTWPLQHLRRYGLTGDIFSFETGRRCQTGHGVYSFRCCNADQFYAKFQRCINSMSFLGDRNSSMHTSHLFSRLDSHQQSTNHYLEPMFVQLPLGADERIVLSDSLSNDANDFNLNSTDSIQDAYFTAEIIDFPSSLPSYSNVNTNPNSHSSNVYMEQQIKNNECNNNNAAQEVTESLNSSDKSMESTPMFKISSPDMPPDECAPIVAPNTTETKRVYANIESIVYTSPNSYFNSAEHCYANIDVPSHLDTIPSSQNRSFQMELPSDQQQQNSSNAPVVNYIILDLDQPRSPSQCSPKDEFGSGHSLLTTIGNIESIKKDELPTITAPISCGSSTMPKGSTINAESILSNKMESFGSYTRIDFLRTFALMKSSANYTDFDLDNDQEESRITRHSKFTRKVYSISD